MCDWTMAAAALVSALGAQQQSSAANDAAERQQDALNAALEQQDQWSRKAESKALENAQQYDMTKRTERLEDTKADAGESLAQSLVASRDAIGSPEQVSGKVSDTFTADRASKMANQFQESVDMARLMGRMRGVSDMLNDESLTNADYATQLGTIGRNAQGSYAAAQPGIAAAGQVDNGQMALGGVMQGLGSAYMANGLGNAFNGVTTGADVGAGVGNANLLANNGASNAAKFKTLNLMG